MRPDDVRPDRQIFSTNNNEYAEGLNDENLWEKGILNVDVALDDEIGEYYATPDVRERPLYIENGYDEERIDG
jgi:hypothetical protein